MVTMVVRLIKIKKYPKAKIKNLKRRIVEEGLIIIYNLRGQQVLVLAGLFQNK